MRVITLFQLTVAAVSMGAISASASAHEPMRVPAGFEPVNFSADGETLSCMKGGTGDPVLLLHGWPETANEWDKVGTILARTNMVLACDLPGVRMSTNLDDDFSKKDMSADIHAALQAAGIGPAHIVGHDIGLMVAFSYAAQFPDDVMTLTVIDAPLPGTPIYEFITADPRSWHFVFHNTAEVPEMVVGNNVRPYIEHFINSFWGNDAVNSGAAIAASVSAYSDPVTLRSGFEFYRAFAQDVEDNRIFTASKLPMPVLALSGGANSPEPYVLQMMAPLANDVTGGSIEGAGHWLSHEKPEELARRIGTFISSSR